MGLAETVKAFILVKADTSDARAQIKQLRGVERDAAKSRLEELEQQNRGIDGQIAMWGKVALGIGAVIGAYKIANAAAKAYLEDVRLQSAAAGANVEKLRDATRGLVETDDLLAFAGKAMHGTWKLNQEEMEKVLHGAMALRKTMGVELKPTIEALTESIAKGNTRALKEFGIEAKDKIGVLAEMDKMWKSVGGSADLAGDDITRAGVSMADTFDDLKGALGELVVALGPVISGLAKMTHLLVDSVEGWKMLLRGGDHLLLGGKTITDLRKDQIVDELKASIDAQQADADRRIKEILAKKATAPFDAYAKEALAAAAKGGGRDRAGKPIGFGDQLYTPDNPFAGMGAGFAAGGKSILAGYQSGAFAAEHGFKYGGEGEFDAETLKLLREDAEKARQAVADLAAEARQTDFATIFGEPAQFNAHAEAVNAMAQAFGALEQAAGAGYEAIVTGSGSASEAMKEALGNSLLALGKEYFVRAIGETAMGLGSLAIWDLKGAANHFAAAGEFAIGAAVAGVGAHALGAGHSRGGGTVPGGGAMSTGAGSGSRGGGDLTRNVTVILGDSWDNESPRTREARLARGIRRAMNANSSSTIRDG